MIEYTIRVSTRAKRLQLRITPLCEVEVVLPQRMGRHHIAPFIEKNRAWIVATQARMMASRSQAARPDRLLPDTILLTAIGQSYTVSFREGEKNRIRETGQAGEQPVLELASASQQGACKILQDWLSRQARQHLPPWLDTVSCELDIPYQKTVIRAQKTRWGSCSSAGVISLNRALLFLEPELVRYLFIHELCHRVHMNHSPRYWRLVGNFSPAYRSYEKRLGKAAQSIPLWSLRRSPAGLQQGICA